MKLPAANLVSVPGCIIVNPDENVAGGDVIEYVKNNKEFTSFLVGDVFSFNGNDVFTTVIVNRINPVWHFVLMPYEEFLKVMV